MNPKPWLTCLLPAMALLAGTLDARADGLVQVAQHRAAFGEVGAGTPPLLGYLARPDGSGPFPAAVVLTGCDGINEHYLDAAATLKSWGYVALVLDALGGGDACKNPPQGAQVEQADAYPALHYLSTQSFVDPAKVALIGYSMGAGPALALVQQDAPPSPQSEHFRAAVAYYPWCGDKSGVMTVPVLIVIGEADDWCPADLCKKMVAHESDATVQRPSGGGVPVKLVVYPGATHHFDWHDLTLLGHVMRYDATAANDAKLQMRAFLQRTMSGDGR